MDKITQLTAFVKIMEKNSFTLAAEELCVSNGTVSKWINNLEEAHGCQLLIRKGSSIVPTTEGVVFYQQSLEVLESYQKLLDNVLQSKTKGRINLCIPKRYGEVVLFSILLDFCDEFPDIQLTIKMCDEKESAFKKNFDLVIKLGFFAEQDVVARQLGELKRLLVAPAWLINKNKINDIAYLRQLPIILHDHCQRTELEKLLGSRLSDEQIVLQFESSSCIVDAIKRKGALSILPLFEIENLLTSGEMIRLLPSNELPNLPINIIYPNRNFVKPLTKLLIQYITTQQENLST